MTAPRLAIRPMRAADQPFVRDSWFRSARRHWTGTDEGLRDRIDHVLDRGRVSVCAGLSGEPLVGFVAAYGVALEWAYVKRSFRGRGIGRALVASIARSLTPLTHSPSVRRAMSAREPA